jgi:hypothetical protein
MELLCKIHITFWTQNKMRAEQEHRLKVFSHTYPSMWQWIGVRLYLHKLDKALIVR